MEARAAVTARREAVRGAGKRCDGKLAVRKGCREAVVDVFTARGREGGARALRACQLDRCGR